MAITLKQVISIDIGEIVASAIAAAKIEKNKKQAKIESDFQKMIADGNMSYEAQLEFRQKQLDDERASSMPNEDTINDIEFSIKNVKKLQRYNKYNQKYLTSFSDLKAGRITANQHLDFLKQSLGTTIDPEMQSKIYEEMVAAENEVKQYEDSILKNQVTRAQNDGTIPLLREAIDKVTNKKAFASLKGNEEEVSAYDNTLTVLNSQINKAQIENRLNGLEINSISKNLGAIEKVDALGREIQNSDINTPLTINGKKYNSAREYWTQLRDGYLAGNGTGMFSNFFNEIENAYSKKIDAAVARDGFATTATLDSIKKDFGELKQKAEYQPYLNRVADLESSALSVAFKSTAQTIINRADYSGDFKEADAALQSYQQKYGTDTQSYRLSLGNKLTAQIAASATALGKTPAEIEKESGVTGLLTPKEFPVPKIPEIKTEIKTAPVPTPISAPVSAPIPIPAPITAATTTPTTPTLESQKIFEVKEGDTLSAIAQRELGSAARWRELKTDIGQTFDEETAKTLSIGTKLVLPQK